jgi:hypothetical protein
MAKQWVPKILLLGTSLGVSLAIAEGMVRVFSPHSRDMVIPGQLFTIDDELGWKLRANRTSIHRTRYFTVEYAINALGFRDKSRSNARGSRPHRTLLYGDSAVFGWGVPQADRFSDLLEQRISGLEVWNHAVPGWGLDQEVLFYEREAESLWFDEAMFFVSRGTLKRIHTGYIYAKYKPAFTLGADGGLQLEPIPTMKNREISFLYEVFSPFYLPYFLQTQMAILKETFVPETLAKSPGEPKYVDELAKDLLERAYAATQRNNHYMSVLIADIFQADRKDLRQFCEEKHIDFLEVPLGVAATSTTDDRMDLVLGRFDRHWNAKANRLIADELEQQIRR